MTSTYREAFSVLGQTRGDGNCGGPIKLWKPYQLTPGVFIVARRHRRRGEDGRLLRGFSYWQNAARVPSTAAVNHPDAEFVVLARCTGQDRGRALMDGRGNHFGELHPDAARLALGYVSAHLQTDRSE